MPSCLCVRNACRCPAVRQNFIITGMEKRAGESSVGDESQAELEDRDPHNLNRHLQVPVLCVLYVLVGYCRSGRYTRARTRINLLGGYVLWLWWILYHAITRGGGRGLWQTEIYRINWTLTMCTEEFGSIV